MKRTILVVLMAVMIATPCLAQAKIPDWIYSLSGTIWASTCHTKTYNCSFGIYEGAVYGFDRGFCWDMGVKYYGELPIISFYPNQNDSGFRDIAIFLPTIGFGIEIWTFDRPPYLSIALFYKVDDAWEPAGCTDPGFG